jgi:hypothetical protein
MSTHVSHAAEIIDKSLPTSPPPPFFKKKLPRFRTTTLQKLLHQNHGRRRQRRWRRIWSYVNIRIWSYVSSNIFGRGTPKHPLGFPTHIIYIT